MPGSKRLPPAARLAWFALALLLADRGVYYAVAAAETLYYRDPGFEREFRDYARGRRFETLILGTSRAREALHPAAFRARGLGDAYSEAGYGKGARYNLHFYRFFRKEAGAPRVAVYGVDYFIFQTRSNKRWLARFPAALGTGPFSSPSLLVADKTDLEEFLAVLAGASPDGPERGYDASIPEAQAYVGTDPAPGRVAAERPPSFKRVGYARYPGQEGADFRRLLEELAADGVKIALVIIPDHIGTFRTNMGRAPFLSDLRALAREVPAAEVFDFNRRVRFPQDRADLFLDGGWGFSNSHLSRAGAELFAARLLDALAPLYARPAATGPGAPDGAR